MTIPTIEEMRELVAKATSGPWYVPNDPPTMARTKYPIVYMFHGPGSGGRLGNEISEVYCDQDAAFIAAARTWVPMACDMIDMATKDIGKLMAILDGLRTTIAERDDEIERLRPLRDALGRLARDE